jgi:CheY-like chemotaxis protein
MPPNACSVPKPSRPVLVIEDDRDSRLLMQTLLRLEGYSVVGASNGREGLDVTRSEHPCVILLDLMMPVMDGVEFRQAQVGDPEIRNIPVIVVSARHDARSTASSLGVAGCVGKPIDLEELSATVAETCRTVGHK